MVKPFEVLSMASPGDPQVVLTCEHASERVPSGFDIPAELRGTHRAWDPGAAALTRVLSGRLGAPAVLAGVSRLLIDVNRDISDPELIMESVDGIEIASNAGLTPDQREERVERWHHPFHAAVNRCCEEGAALLVSVHTFTPELGEERRDFHYGLLHAGETSAVNRAYGVLRTKGREVRLNEPYSGLHGKIYSVARHGWAHGIDFMEFEVRNDLLGSPRELDEVASHLCDAVAAVFS